MCFQKSVGYIKDLFLSVARELGDGIKNFLGSADRTASLLSVLFLVEEIFHTDAEDFC